MSLLRSAVGVPVGLGEGSLESPDPEFEALLWVGDCVIRHPQREWGRGGICSLPCPGQWPALTAAHAHYLGGTLLSTAYWLQGPQRVSSAPQESGSHELK